MNCGLPVVATNVVGAAAGGLVVHDQTGLVVPERDPRSLALALEELIQNASKRRRLGETAQSRVLNWTHASAADAYERALTAARQRKGQAYPPPAGSRSGIGRSSL